jgi:hypothetical protein
LPLFLRREREQKLSMPELLMLMFAMREQQAGGVVGLLA